MTQSARDDNIDADAIYGHVEFPLPSFDTSNRFRLSKFPSRAVRIASTDIFNAIMWVVSVCFIYALNAMSCGHQISSFV